MIGWIMSKIRLFACLLCLFINFNSSIYALTAVDSSNIGIESDVSFGKSDFGGEGDIIRKRLKRSDSNTTLYEEPIPRAQGNIEKLDSSNISQNAPKKDEEYFDDTETFFEEDGDDIADIKSEKGHLKRSESNATLYEEPIPEAQEDVKKKSDGEITENKNTENLKKVESESARSNGNSWTTMKALQKLKSGRRSSPENSSKISDDKENILKDGSSNKDPDTKSEKNSRPVETKNIGTKKRSMSLQFPISISGIKGYRRITPRYYDELEDNGSGIYGSQMEGRDTYNTFSGNNVRYYSEGTGGRTSMSGNYRKTYIDDGSGIYDPQTEERDTYNTFSGNNIRYYSDGTGRRYLSSRNGLRRSRSENIKFEIDLSSFGEKLKDRNNDSEDEEEENGDEGEKTSVAQPMQMLTLQQSNPSMIQNTSMMSTVSPNLIGNENLNGLMNMQQMPQGQTIQYVTAAPVNMQNTVTDNSKPSFFENFLQNLTGGNNNNQNLGQLSNQQLNGNVYNQNMNQLNQGTLGLGQVTNNSNMGYNDSLLSGMNMSGGRNMSDDEVVEKTIRYLRDLGVIDESKFVKLNIDSIGTCISCRTQTIVVMLDKEKRMGICKTCAKRFVSDAQSGKFLGDGNLSKVSRRDSSADLSGDMVREGLSQNKDDPAIGNLGKVLSVENIASAALSTMANTDSSLNPNGQMGQNMLGQSIPMAGVLTPSQMAGGGLMDQQMLMNQQGLVDANGMPLQQASMLNSGANAIAAGMPLQQASMLNSGTNAMMNGAISGQMSSLGMDSSMATTGVAGTSNMGKIGKIAAGVAAGAAVLGAGVAVLNKLKKSGSSSTEQMVLNANGELVPLSSWKDASAPYGYKVDPTTGALVPAASLEEGLAAAQSSSEKAEQMVLNANGELVPLSSWKDASAPYGYKVDPTTGALVPATSLEEGLAAAQEVAAAQKTSVAQKVASAIQGAGSKLKTAGKVAAGVAVGAAALGATVAALKAIKKSKSSSKNGTNNGTGTTGSNGAAGSDGSNKGVNSSTGASSSGTTASGTTASDTQSEASKTYSADQLEDARKTKKRLDKSIKKSEKEINSLKSKIEKAEKAVNDAQKRVDAKPDDKRRQSKLDAAKEKLQSLQESLKTQQESMEKAKKDLENLQKEYGADLDKKAA